MAPGRRPAVVQKLATLYSRGRRTLNDCGAARDKLTGIERVEWATEMEPPTRDVGLRFAASLLFRSASNSPISASLWLLRSSKSVSPASTLPCGIFGPLWNVEDIFCYNEGSSHPLSLAWALATCVRHQSVLIRNTIFCLDLSEYRLLVKT